MKALRVTMPDGSRWDVPADIIANSRADYYAGLPGTEAYQKEYDFTLNDEYELVDWAENNMNWEDVEASATRAEEPPDVDFQEGWVNGEKEVVDLPD